MILNLPEILNSGSIKSGFNNITNFFTQRQLTDKAISSGLTTESISQLTKYNNLITQGVTRTQAFKQTMIGATDATKQMAVNISNGSVQLNELTTASKAAQLGMSLLSSALNIGASFAISAAIKLVYELGRAYENAAEKAEKSIAKAKERKEESNQIQELIDKYKELKEAETSDNKQETRKQTLELQKEITNLIASQPDLYSQQVKNIDLVNGGLNEQLEILEQINQENSKSAIKSAASAYRDSAEATSKYKYDVKGAQIGGKNVVWLEGESESFTNDLNGQKIIDDLLKHKFIGKSHSDFGGNGESPYYNIEFAKNTTWIERLKFIDEALEALEQSPEFDTSKAGLYDQLLEAREDINKVVSKQTQAATDYAQLITESTINQNKDSIKSYKDFEEARKKIIDDISNDGTIKMALTDGALSKEDIEKSVNDYMSTLNGLSDYYDEWVRRNTFALEGMTDAEKAWYAQQQQMAKNKGTFLYDDYKDQIEEVEKSFSTLFSLYEKLNVENPSLSVSDLSSALKEFPELSPYIDNTNKLKEKVKELNNEKVTSLIDTFTALKNKISDPEQLEQLDGWINYLYKMLDLEKAVKSELENITVSDYIKYEEDNIQNIIDKLEKEKDAQNEILDNLKAQKEELESIISDYEKTADAVGKYIDRTQIKPLENQKSEIEEYYNTEIEKLKEENNERDRNIDLQKKQDALANARKNKVRVYSETEGWHYEKNTTAIEEAEKELANYKNQLTIEDLEKQRDSEVKGIENQIKVWEDYKEKWKEQVETITEADEELIASKVLGSEWQEKIANQDIEVMDNFSSEYVSYNNQLKNQVNIEITNLERVIKSREKEIADWKNYKQQVSDLNKDITDSNSEYLKNLNQFALDENSTWEQRIEHMKRNVEIIAELNKKANDLDNEPEPEPEPEPKPKSTTYAIMRNNEILQSYATEETAKQAKEKLVEDLIKNVANAPGIPSNVVEQMKKNILNSIKIEKIEAFASGGISSNTGFAWLDGTKNNSEVVFNAQQAKKLFDLVNNGDFSSSIKNNILKEFKNSFNQLNTQNQQKNATNSISISFPNAQINAKDYESFKGFMDRYTNDLLLKLQTGM